MIGEAMPRFDRLSAAFRDDVQFQQVIGDFYSDILEFHRSRWLIQLGTAANVRTRGV